MREDRIAVDSSVQKGSVRHERGRGQTIMNSEGTYHSRIEAMSPSSPSS